MSDSEDESAFASADEGDDETNKSTQAQAKPKSTQVKKDQQKPDHKEETKAAVSGDRDSKPQTQSGKGKSKNPKNESQGSVVKHKSEKQEQVKTQSQQGKGGKNVQIKGSKGKPVEKQVGKKEKVETTSSTLPVVKEATSDSNVKIDEPSKTQVSNDSEKQEKVVTESAKSSLTEDLTTETSKTEDVGNNDNGEIKKISSDIDKAGGDKSDRLVKSLQESKPTDDEKKVEPKKALDKLAEDEDEESGDGWSWGNWGTSLMDVAATSVSTFTHQVGEGFNTILDTVETTLGAPSPEELVMDKGMKEKDEETIKTAPEATSIDRAEDIEDEKEETKEVSEVPNPESESESKKSSKAGGGWFSGWDVSSLTSVVQSTTHMVQSKSKELVSGGLDVLETIGKKTIDVIKDHDPGLKKTKELFLFDKGDKQNLSAVLREAKEEAAINAEKEKEFEESRKAHFGCMFDEYQGLAHLEALEILSNQCEKKVQVLLTSMPTETLAEIKTDLIQIKQVFEREEEDEEEEEETEHDFPKLITEYLSEFHLGTTPDKLNKTQEKIRLGIADFYEKKDDSKWEPKMVHQKAIQSLAELTAKSVEQFHKAGELVLLQKDSDKKFLDRSKSLSSFTKVLCTEIGILSTKFSHCLNRLAEEMEDSSVVNPLLTNVYLEATNSGTYIQDAFQLLLPCLQQAMIESTTDI